MSRTTLSMLAVSASLLIAGTAAAQHASPVTTAIPSACVERGRHIDPNGTGSLSPPVSNNLALDAANRCVAARGMSGDYNARGYILFLMKDYAAAQRDYDAAIALGGNGNVYRNRGDVRLRTSNWAGAITDYRQALSMGASDPAAVRTLLANALRNTGRHDESIAEARRALAIDPGYRFAMMELATTLGEMDRNEEAVAEYTRALSMRPRDADALNGRANRFIALERWGEALRDTEAAIASNAQLGAAHSNRAFALHRLGRLDEAVASQRRAIAVDGTSVTNWVNLCMYTAEAGDGRGALVACDRAEQIGGATPGAISTFRGRAYEAMGDNAAAIRFYRLALTLVSDALMQPQTAMREASLRRARTRATDGLLRLGVQP